MSEPATTPDALRVEYATGGGTEIAGSVLPLDIGPAPAWRNLRVPVDTLPDDTTAIRLVARSTSSAR